MGGCRRCRRRKMGRPRKGAEKSHRKPDRRRVLHLMEEMRAAGEAVPDGENEEEFRRWLKSSSEKELWFFSRWILGNDWLGLGSFHRTEACPFLTSYSESRFKLLMLPMGHMKTTIASRSMPLHMLVQPAATNIYFPWKNGADTCILIGNENEQKSKENLGVLKTQLEDNDW